MTLVDTPASRSERSRLEATHPIMMTSLLRRMSTKRKRVVRNFRGLGIKNTSLSAHG